MVDFVIWWVTIQGMGLAALPIAARIMRWLPGRGYAFSKIAGLLIISYLVWFGAVAGLWLNDLGGLALVFVLTAGLSAWALLSEGREDAVQRISRFWKANYKDILVVEILFLLTFAGWAVVRAYAPDKILPAGGEKYMEIAFLNGILNSPRFPPIDPWLAGYGISYYYFGYVMMAVLTRLTHALPTVAFDLYDALLFGLTCLGAYGVISAMVTSSRGKRIAARLSGVLGALFVAGLGNLEGLLEGLYSSRVLPDSFWRWVDIPDLLGSVQTGGFYPGDGWWWWRASRVLRDIDLANKPVVFQPIDEFPFFSFLLGDNHPHKLALPFALLCIGLAFNLLQKISRENGTETLTGAERVFGSPGMARRSREAIFFWGFYALALGSLGFLNTWDMPVYLAVILLAYFSGIYSGGHRVNFSLLWKLLRAGLALGIGAVLFYIFFYLGFSSQAGGVLPYIFQPTRLVQYMVMFGPFVIILAIFLWMAGYRLAVNHALGWRAFLRQVLRAWAWVAGGLYGVYLLILMAAALILEASNNPAVSALRYWLNNLTTPQALLQIVEARLATPWLFLAVSFLLALASAAFAHRSNGLDTFINQTLFTPAARFALGLAFVGLGLSLVVDFFYLRDLFLMRMNTVFKFYFQGWVLMACASAYAVWWVLAHSRGAVRAGFTAVTILLAAGGLVYPVMGVASRVERFRNPPTLDAAATVAGAYPGHWAAQPADWKAIQWINQTIRPVEGAPPTILEAPGGAYQNNGRISAFTGLPTLLGWANHEGQWRGNMDEINLRLPDIQKIYTTPSAEEALDLLRKWKVSYVVLGEAERQFIDQTCDRPETLCSPARALAKFETLLIPVYSEQGITIYAVP